MDGDKHYGERKQPEWKGNKRADEKPSELRINWRRK
jgi:hypothetical protein